MRETFEHHAAFERYYVAGKDRSLAALAGECGVSERTVKRWSLAFDWQLRVEQRDLENGKKLAQVTDATIIAAKVRLRKVVDATLGRYVEAFQQKDVEVKTVADLERLVKMTLLLLGEPDSRSEEVKENAPSWEEIAREKGLDLDEVRRRAKEIVAREYLVEAESTF